MKTLSIASFATSFFVLCAGSAWAQQDPDTDAYDGRWNVSMQPGGGRPFVATLTLANFGGTWQDGGTGGVAKDKACKGKKFPITVQASVSTRLEFTVWGTAVSPGCPNVGMTLKPVDAKTLEGSTASGEPVRLTRR